PSPSSRRTRMPARRLSIFSSAKRDSTSWLRSANFSPRKEFILRCLTRTRSRWLRWTSWIKKVLLKKWRSTKRSFCSNKSIIRDTPVIDQEWDVILIGAGQNNFALGTYLGLAGLKTVICESRLENGGRLAPEEIPIPRGRHKT